MPIADVPDVPDVPDVSSVVLGATDGSPHATAALRSGLAALKPAARLLIVTVVEPADMSLVHGTGLAGGVISFEEKRQLLDDQHATAVALLAKTVDDLDEPDAEVAVLEGDPAREICRAAVDHAARVIVLGTRGRGGVARFLLGSVSLAVVRNAPCPVLTVG